MNRKTILALAVAAAGAIAAPSLAIAAATATTAASKAKLTVRSGSLGKYVADSSGRTLYLFTKDTSKASKCSGSCATAWPPYLTSGKPTAGTGVSAKKIGTIKRSDGSTQVTYGGHPLYRYAADKAKGQTTGQGVGSAWYLVKPDGKRLSTKATQTTPTTTPTDTTPATAPSDGY